MEQIFLYLKHVIELWVDDPFLQTVKLLFLISLDKRWYVRSKETVSLTLGPKPVLARVSTSSHRQHFSLELLPSVWCRHNCLQLWLIVVDKRVSHIQILRWCADWDRLERTKVVIPLFLLRRSLAHRRHLLLLIHLDLAASLVHHLAGCLRGRVGWHGIPKVLDLRSNLATGLVPFHCLLSWALRLLFVLRKVLWQDIEVAAVP